MSMQAPIAVLAPIVPYRGGIAQHSSMLVNALSETREVRVLSYRRLYPEWLYPGSSTKEPETLLDLAVPVEFDVDSVDPFTWRNAQRRIVTMRPAAVVIPWWTAFLAPLYLYLARRLRRAGIPVVFFCHNVIDHEAAAWKQFLAKRVLRSGSLFIVQTRAEERRLCELIGERRIVRHPHPVYAQLPEPEGTLPRRAELELLFFGAIRPYKGLHVLLAALSRVKAVDWHLSIVGEAWWKEGETTMQLLDDLDLGARVEAVLRYVSDLEAAEYFARADAVVLPYRNATGTGVIAAAYRYRKPVIGTRVGGVVDVTVEGKNALLVEPENPQQLADAIIEFARRGLPESIETTEALIRELTWHGMARKTIAAIDTLAQQDP